jgi:F-type H+-transporting ATPase subunit a
MNIFGLVPFLKSPAASLVNYPGVYLFAYLFMFSIRRSRNWGSLGILIIWRETARNPGLYRAYALIYVFLAYNHGADPPLSLSLRLRGNMWGDEVLIALLSGFGIAGLPLLFFNMLMGVLAAVVQASVFCLLTTIYLALVLRHDDEKETI